jgi:UDP-N-acetylmuramate--alanine ligase
MQEIDLKGIKSVHFLGIGGIGISAIARMFHLEGKKVSGSDLSLSEVTEELEKLGIVVKESQSVSDVPQKTDLIIYSTALSEYAAEFLKEVKKLGIPMLTYPETLHLISKEKYTIAIAGTHGKTTTTAMIAKVLVDAKADPTVIVGSFLKDTKSNLIVGKSNFLVVEACEYRRSFLQLEPTILVITNIDNDHLDYYKDVNDIAKAFGELAAKIPKDGYVVCNPNDNTIKKALKDAKCSVIDYTKAIETNLKLKIPGTHTLSNAGAALSVATILHIEKLKVEKSLRDFSGTWRRFEHKGQTKEGIIVYDDYGHHPTEIKATLQGARELFSKQKITVIFQPHLFSRTKLLFEEFAASFGDADQVFLAPIYPAREVFDPTISSEMLAKAINKKGKEKARAFVDFQSIQSYIQNTFKKGDVVMTMGAGDIYKVGEELVK